MDDRGRRARALRDADRGDDARRRTDARRAALGEPARAPTSAPSRATRTSRGDQLTLFRNEHGDAIVRLIAGDSPACTVPGNTHTPIIYAHATLQPGAHLALEWPQRVQRARLRALGHAVASAATTARILGDGQVAALGAGDAVVVDADASARRAARGVAPRRPADPEPVFSYGPFVMNTKQEIIEALDDFEAGKMGSIPPRTN